MPASRRHGRFFACRTDPPCKAYKDGPSHLLLRVVGWQHARTISPVCLIRVRAGFFTHTDADTPMQTHG